MNSKIAIGAALGGAALLGALAVAYSNSQPGKGGQSVKAGEPTTAAFDGAQEEAIRTIVRAYLSEHPEVLVEALNGYEEKQRIAQEAAMLENARKNLAVLTRPDHGFVAGVDPAAADVAVIELFDYHCSFCKRAMGAVRDLTRSDRRVKVVFRELPILREESEYAAKAALAARAQGKYAELHFALMEANGVLTKDRIAEIAAKTGIDAARLKADAESPAIKESLAETERIAREMEVDGTPTFIVASLDGGFVEVIPGFRAEALKEAISKAKKAAQKK